MTALQSLAHKAMEWAMIAALVGVIGYLVGNSEASGMKAEIERLRADVDRHEDERKSSEQRLRDVQTARRAFMNNSVGPLNFLCERDPDCRDRFPVLIVPE